MNKPELFSNSPISLKSYSCNNSPVTLKVYIVNTFTNGERGGSPTGVVLNAFGLTDARMRKIAATLPVSRTVFVFETTDENESIKIRFFTRSGEILNCAQGTIAANYLRAKNLRFKYSALVFQELKTGVQSVEVVKRGDDYSVYLLQNETMFSAVSQLIVEELLEALHLNETDLSDDLKVISASPGSSRFLVGLKSYECVYDAVPDFDRLKHVCFNHKSIGCFIYSVKRSEEKFKATARMFAPNIGVNEDIINGNSSGCLGAYLLKSNPAESLELCVNQGQKFNRDGTVKVRVRNIGGRFEAVIGGSARLESEITMEI
jgi:PhzF family phenazine biosynthesis protein